MKQAQQLFAVRLHSEYVRDLLDKLQRGEADQAIISSMNLHATEGSDEYEFLRVIQELNRNRPSGEYSAWIDVKYAKRMSAMPNGHFMFRKNPFDLVVLPTKLKASKITNANLKEFDDIIVPVSSRHNDLGKDAGLWKILFSWHLLQPFSVQHVKIGLVKLTKSKSAKSVAPIAETTISNGEFVSVGEGQNNLALTFYDNEKLATFLHHYLNPNYRATKKFVTSEILPGVDIVIDFGHRGTPRFYPELHTRSRRIIEQSSEVVVLSQYVPDGLIFRSLATAARNHAKVIVPMEPPHDYHRTTPALGTLYKYFIGRVKRLAKKGIKIQTPDRPVRSHVKCLIAKHADGTASMIFGSYNFDSVLHKLAQNTEASICIERAKPGTIGYEIIKSMRDKLVELQEFSAETLVLK